LLRVTIVSLVLGSVAALLPARQIAGLEPVAVLRGVDDECERIDGQPRHQAVRQRRHEVVAVRDVSLEVEPGEVVLIMGPSARARRHC